MSLTQDIRKTLFTTLCIGARRQPTTVTTTMKLTKYISIPIFALSFLFGLMAVYMFMQGETRKIYVYPTPENLEKIQYKDSTDTCFEFKQMEVACPVNDSLMSKIPIQA